MQTSNRKGFGLIKLVVLLVVLVVLGLLGGGTYFGWKQADMSEISGREKILKGESASDYVDIKQKVVNALNSNAEVSITESELNHYIAKNMMMNQTGFIKGFATVKGVFIDLKPDMMEIFIEREIAQYTDDGEIQTDVFKPFNQTVSMKLKIYRNEDEHGKKTTKIEFPGGTIGMAPAPGMLVKIVKPSFDQIYEHFVAELDLGFKKMNKITITDGKIILDPRLTVN